MDPRCRTTRDRLAQAGPDTAPAEEVRGHLARCAACRAWAHGLRRLEEALAGLPRRAAPAALDDRVALAIGDGVGPHAGARAREARCVAALHRLAPGAAPTALDGLVVAALQAGTRQERALRHLGGLARLDAPGDLASGHADHADAVDARERDHDRPGAHDEETAELAGAEEAAEVVRGLRAWPSPAVLERLVEEDLHDLPRALARRFSDKLRRVPAPAALEDRVRADLARSGRAATSRFGSFARGLRDGSRPPVAAAAAMVLLAFLGWAAWRVAPTPGATEVDPGHRVAIEVRRMDAMTASADPSVSPLGQRLVDQLSAARLAREVHESDEDASGPFASADGGTGPGGDAGGGDTEAGESDETGESDGDGADGNDGSPTPEPGGDGPAGGSDAEEPLAPRAPPLPRDLLERMRDAHTAAVHLVRVVDRSDADAVVDRLVFEEEVWRDGQGGFSVRATDVHHPPMSAAAESTLRLLQSARQGYVERLRDFRVRDVALFRQNYALIDLRRLRPVAGVPCRMVEVQRLDGIGFAWRLAVDPRSGLVLAEERVDASGEVVLRSEVLQLDHDPDLSGVVLDGGPSAWSDADPATLAASGVLHVPTSLPDGYLPNGVATITDAQGREWVRQGFTDGVSQLFLLHESSAPSTPISQHVNTRAVAEPDVVTIVPVAGQLVLDGEVRGVRVVASGPIGEHALLRIVDSALP